MPKNLVTVAKVGEIPPGRVKCVDVQDFHLAVCNVGGVIYCVENTCTHDGGPLDQGELVGDVVECPRHGARFNVVNGSVVRMPAVAPLETFDVSIAGNDIVVDLE
jgi:3-phenylpropionate/trans-cinnamate dioxygenase ferredoxin component